MVCKHHIIKPFAGAEGPQRAYQEGIRFSAAEKEYCTHANSLHLPGTAGGVTCGGDITKCHIPMLRR